MRFSTLALIAFLPLTVPAARACPDLSGEYVACGDQGTKSAERLIISQKNSAEGITTYAFTTRYPGAADHRSEKIADGKNRSVLQAGEEVLQTTASCGPRTLSVILDVFASPSAPHSSARARHDYSRLHTANGPVLVQKISGETEGATIRHYARDAVACDEFARIRADLKNRGN